MQPIKLTLKGEDYLALSVQWRIFKAITRLAGVSSADVTLDDWYNLAGLVARIFDNQFSVDALKEKSSAELIAVLNQVMARVHELAPKPEEKSQETPANSSSNWVVELELSLINRFGWSLNNIDCTDVESLLPFITQLNEAGNLMVFADQVDWL